MCSCGNIPGALVNNSFCNKPCDGDQNKICGSGISPLHNSVFATGRWCNIKSNLCVKLLIIRRMSTPIDGGWSTWTSWSSCQSNCRQQRNRTCDSPTPLFGGNDCLGNKTELREGFIKKKKKIREFCLRGGGGLPKIGKIP